MNQKIKTLPALCRILKKLKAKGSRIVFTNGCFDIPHLGHVSYLRKAKLFGDVLVVGLNTDRSVRKIKGPSRPINAEKDRAEVLSEFASVDYITFFGDPTPLGLIRRLRPDVLVKGADWKPKDIVGRDFVESYGGCVKRVRFVPGRSTTNVLKKLGLG
ncbi:MAG TPA: D-glycero-beta-D-manno-heptose 1-phosphate adenylyltransferase [Candidatus Omnitrophota bacterium]|nr:D-glycero-beta-D-manno-heptose 1-phosphate adenylyltransferase [Candidatus Omnitrophota bacterium]